MTPQTNTSPAQGDDISALQKAELHIHLEGSLDRGTLDRIGARKGLPSLKADPYVFEDFEGFNRVFGFLARFLEDEADFYDAALALAERQARDRIVYTECLLMPLFHLSRGIPVEALYQGVENGLHDGEARFGTRIRLLFCVPRVFGAEAGLQTLEVLETHPWDRVLGLDLAGTERPGDVPAFAPVFEKARSLGLHTVAHAGEFAGPDQVAQTLDLLGAERIGHGLHAAEDPALLERLARDQVPLEVCPTSNVRLRAVPSLEDHPVRRLFDAGVPLVVNTDDPAFFHTTLIREFQVLTEHFGFTSDEIRAVIQNGFRFSFERSGNADEFPL